MNIITPIHIMIDLETWGTQPGCDLRSIGACSFDPETGSIPDGIRRPFNEPSEAKFYQNIDGGDMYGLTKDPETEKWWLNQSAEAQSQQMTNQVDIVVGLLDFAKWLKAICPDPTALRLWSHGPSFDEVILRVAYQRVGVTETPWHYRAPRDTRTILEAAGIDPHKGLDMFATGTHHNALYDAITQAKAVCAAYKVLQPVRQAGIAATSETEKE